MILQEDFPDHSVSHDHFIDKHQKVIERLRRLKISDKRVKNDDYNHILSNETVRKKIDLMSIS